MKCIKKIANKNLKKTSITYVVITLVVLFVDGSGKSHFFFCFIFHAKFRHLFYYLCKSYDWELNGDDI